MDARRALSMVLSLACVGSALADPGEAPPASFQAAGLALSLPTGWRSVPPASQMRAAQVEVPGAAGAAELVVFWFGAGQGGDVEANVARWLSQVEQAPGATPARGASQAASGLKITWVEAAGTLAASNMGAPTPARPGSRLLGAVVEGGPGPWFFKLTGPDATVAAAREAFLKMLVAAVPPAAGSGSAGAP